MIERARAAWGFLGNRSGSIVLRIVLIAVMLAIPLAAPGVFVIQGWNDKLVAKRFQMAPRNASQAVIFIAIDKKSLDAVGAWPWPRSIYADLIERLSTDGAGDIFVDVDFSSASSPVQDVRLAEALSRAGGSVLLPVFRQQVAASSSQNTITRPIDALLQNAWPVFANVALDPDGNVRRFELGDMFDGVATQSAAAALAKANRSDGNLLIDYSIRPETVPTYSLSDVLAGTIGADAVRGRSVVIGASATELKDIFPVPVYSALAGPLIHVLAAETLLQDRELHVADQTPVELLFAAVLIVGVLCWRNLGILGAFAVFGIFGLLGEAGAFVLQAQHGYVVETAVFWLILLVTTLLFLNERVDVGQMLVVVANMEQRNTRRLMQRIISDSSDGVIAFDSELKIVELSKSGALLIGGVAGAPLSDCADDDLMRHVAELIDRHTEDPSVVHSSSFDLVKHGGKEVTHIEATLTMSPIEKVDGARRAHSYAGCLILRDVTTRRLYDNRIRYLAERDDLTGLLNRREFAARLGTLSVPHDVAVFDLERFSAICATLGRDAGDDMLTAVARRLSFSIGSDLCARLDGDVFAVATRSIDGRGPEMLATRLLGLFQEPVDVGATDLPIAIRIGLVRAETGAAENWLRAAEAALGQAKTTVGRLWSEYDPTSAIRQARSRRLEMDMRGGLKDGQFFLLFQPQIDIASGQLVGAEALIRWQHPEFGLVSPVEFIPIAESTGLICEMGRWAINDACAQAASWPRDISVAVNVSPIQFERSNIEAEVYEAIERSGLLPSRLCLELTESSFLEQGGPIVELMNRLRLAGITIALDDFGTGYSSLSYLAGLPLDKLKIDQSFVRAMCSDIGVMEIVKAVVVLAHGLKLGVVAEGVENEAEVDTLRVLGCETCQGYLFGKPQMASELFAVNRPYHLLAVSR